LSRDYFKRSFFSPYFQSNHYQETHEAKVEQKIEAFFMKWFTKKDKDEKDDK